MISATKTSRAPLVLEAGDFDACLPPADVLEALRASFRGLASGNSVQPPQTLSLFPRDMGDVIAYSGVLADQGVFGAKLSPYFPGRKQGSKVTAWTILFSLETGNPVLLCDSLALTTERTAATTVLAVQLLLPATARRLAIFGTGPVAAAHLRYATAIHRWERVVVYSRRIENDRRSFDSVASKFPQAEAADSAEQAVRESDVILLCTSSASPVIDYRWLRPGQLVTSISTNAPGAHEIDPAALTKCEVYCDYRATTPAVAGEMKQAAKLHGWSPENISGDLPEVVTGTARPPSGNAPVFFRSVGLGIEDIAIANALLANVEKSSGN